MRKDWKHAARLSGGLCAQRDTACSDHALAMVLCVSSVRFACMYVPNLVVVNVQRSLASAKKSKNDQAPQTDDV